MTEHDDDAMRDLVRRAYAAETEPPDADVTADWHDVLNRARDERRAALPRGGREWFVALALAEPLLSGAADPRPPSNREIYERVIAWRGDAWNLARPQSVADAIEAIAQAVFPEYKELRARQQIRTALGRRIVAVGLVTLADLANVDHAAARSAES